MSQTENPAQPYRLCVVGLMSVQRTNVRTARRSFYPDVWDVFGGHQNRGESREDALRRELSEELGIVPTRWKFLLTAEEPNESENGAGLYHFYLVTAFDGTPQNLQPDEHAAVLWFGFAEAVNLPFAHPLYVEMIARISKKIK